MISVINENGDIDLAKLEWLLEVGNAAKKLIECKGRYHAELNYQALERKVKEEPK